MNIKLRSAFSRKDNKELAGLIAQLYRDNESNKVSFMPVNFISEIQSVSAQTAKIEQYIKEELKSSYAPSTYTSTPRLADLEEKLFDATAVVKIYTSQVGMYLTEAIKKKIFTQLDSIHDINEWDSDDKTLELKSYCTFLKALLLIKPSILPGLGLSPNGHLVASWLKGKDRLIIEFLDKDQIHWVASKFIDDEYERGSGKGDVSKLMSFLSPYNPSDWFNNA